MFTAEAVLQDEGAALSCVENGEAVGIPSLGGVLRGLAAALAQAWTSNPAYRRVSQAYLAAGGAASRLVDDLESKDRDWHDVERARFAVNALTSALAPTNTLPGSPAALKRAFDTAGGSVLRGLGNLVHDVRHNGGMPSQTDRTAFEVGRDLALTPGAVVARYDVAELIQYTPSTPTVRARPVLIIPPPIGRYYFLDLRPGRSFVEHALSQGLQVFLLSWRNPRAEQVWRNAAAKRTGSWWEAWSAWVLERSGETIPPPAGLGSVRHPALEPAPGSYVLDRVPAAQQ